MTDSLERFLQDLRFDLPAGMVEKAKAAAADAGGASQSGRVRVHDRGAVATEKQSWAPAMVAVLLAVAIVATLLLVAHQRQAVPAHPEPHRATPYTIPSPPSAASGCSSVPRQWASSPPNPAKMLSTTTGWAYGPMRTTDGGATWVDVSPPSVPGRTLKNDEFFLDATHAWVAETTTSSSACIDHVVVFRTADGGRTWQQQDDPPLPLPIASSTDVLWTGTNNHEQLFDFIDPLNGWLLLGSGPRSPAESGVAPSWIGATWREGYLYATNDGGATWAVAPNPTAPVGCVPANSGTLVIATTSFSSASDGWMLASCTGSANQADLLITHDSGATWNRATLPLAPKEVPTFFDSKRGVAAAVGGLIVTSDGGRTWTVRNSPVSYGVDFINNKDGWAVGQGDNSILQCRQSNDPACNGNFLLYYTHDGGVSWTHGTRTSLTMMAPKWWPPAYLHFVDSKTGFVEVGEDGLEQGLYLTRDGGQTWTRVNGTIEAP